MQIHNDTKVTIQTIAFTKAINGVCRPCIYTHHTSISDDAKLSDATLLFIQESPSSIHICTDASNNKHYLLSFYYIPITTGSTGSTTERSIILDYSIDRYTNGTGVLGVFQVNSAIHVILDATSYVDIITTLKGVLCNDIVDSDTRAQQGEITTTTAAAAAAATTYEELEKRWWFVRCRHELMAMLPAADEPQIVAYVYNTSEVIAAIQRLHTLTDSGVVNRIFYAMKANSHESVLRTVYEHSVGFECVSIRELHLIFRSFPDIVRSRVLFTPNFAGRHEYEQAFTAYNGIHVTIDNMYILQQWEPLFRGRRILVRVDPGQGKGHHAHVRTGGSRSKFGVSIDELIAHKDHITACIVGFHIHAGSGVFDVENWANNARLLTRLRASFPDVQYLNIGGGVGVAYRPHECAFDMNMMGESLRSCVADDIELWIEPGRYIVADAGIMCCRVTQLKSKPARKFVGVYGGMHALIRPALYDAYHHIMNLSRINDTHDQIVVDVVGPICETGDVLGHDRLLPSTTAPNDWIVIACAGAYGYCMSSDYNLRAADTIELIL